MQFTVRTFTDIFLRLSWLMQTKCSTFVLYDETNNVNYIRSTSLSCKTCLRWALKQYALLSLQKPQGWRESNPCVFMLYASPSGFSVWLKPSRRTNRAVRCWRRRPERRRRPDSRLRNCWVNFRLKSWRKQPAQHGVWQPGKSHMSNILLLQYAYVWELQLDQQIFKVSIMIICFLRRLKADYLIWA